MTLKRYRITYRNQGKLERAYYDTREDAENGVRFLKMQGAASVRLADTLKERRIK